ncbi:translation initiation factor IF-2 [bacterium]|nr:translation initiation factor IF-2 [bacterium]
MREAIKELEKEFNIDEESLLWAAEQLSLSPDSMNDEEIELLREFIKERLLPIPQNITVRDLAERMSIQPTSLVADLLKVGLPLNLNQAIDFELARKLARERGFIAVLQEEKEKKEVGVPRPPVVTVLGHVDHGKTTLLDAIRETRVVDSEAGGITQKIGAYQVEINGKKITFIDTPGHEAFTAMRARGAQVTDIAVLVVAADDGVMPQTIEAINHARAANVPIIVAINKIDKPNANVEMVKRQLAEVGLIPEEWGGDTVCVPISALRKEGLDELLEMILLVAELLDLRANPRAKAKGTVIESRLDPARGPIATVIVQEGTLRVGEPIVAGIAYGKVRAMLDEWGNQLKEAPPSTPAEIMGLNDVPEAGDRFEVVDSEREAREIAERRKEEQKEAVATPVRRLTLDTLYESLQKGEEKELRLVVKANSQGALEAVKQALSSIKQEEAKINIIHSGIGNISESDVLLASVANAIVIGFGSKMDSRARKMAEKERVDVRVYKIIYDLIDEVKAALAGLLTPIEQEVSVGKAEVRALFRLPDGRVAAGCYVTEGRLVRGEKVRVWRGEAVVYEGELDSLRRFKNDVREVAQGFECGVMLEGFNDFQEGDIIECLTIERVPQNL